MENKQTAMKVLMEWMIEESQVIPVDPGDVYQKAKELLVMEKEQMIEFADRYGFDVCHFDYDRADEYYERTYKQQDND
jgi:hypothetical protein